MKIITNNIYLYRNKLILQMHKISDIFDHVDVVAMFLYMKRSSRFFNNLRWDADSMLVWLIVYDAVPALAQRIVFSGVKRRD